MKKIASLIIFTLICLIQQGYSQQITDAQLQKAIEARLYNQTGDKTISKKMAQIVMNQALTWKANSINIKKANSILAFSFGNSYAKNGNQLPGKMNKEIAQTVIEIYNETKLPVYAQWEVAEAIGSKVPKDMLHTIYPVVDDNGLTYLDTQGVASEAVKQAGNTDKLGNTIVVAFKEHELRAVRTSKDLGIKAFAPQGIKLLDTYDKNSGQPWTRDKLTFMLYEIRTRANIARESVSGEIYKK